jgi:peptide-methionine (R)-S-oxide reductase
MDYKVQKTEEQWRAELTPDQYRVCREGGTEPAFTGEYYDCTRPGIYVCVACGQELFAADDKFEASCGWPSFTRPVAESKLETRLDTSQGRQRQEIRCRRCGSHLGHVFPDGPRPTGLRYCLNSVALKLIPQSATEAEE